jgi:hypothetical protein
MSAANRWATVPSGMHAEETNKARDMAINQVAFFQSVTEDDNELRRILLMRVAEATFESRATGFSRKGMEQVTGMSEVLNKAAKLAPMGPE